MTAYSIEKGFSTPLGVSAVNGGLNFVLYSEHATAVTLCLFLSHSSQPFFEVQLDPKVHLTYALWHIWIGNLPREIEYAYRIDGPHLPQKGMLFDPNRLLLDPYAKGSASSILWGKGDWDAPLAPRGCAPHLEPFNWEKDMPPLIPPDELIIYELHVRGFTMHPTSLVAHKGTFLGVVEKIPYLKSLGVNALELMPIFEFNECEYRLNNPQNGERLYNFWGYSSINFFSPMNRYASKEEKGAALYEFKTMVKALHKNGIEVYLDVVFNHTAEGGKGGPTLSFRGVDNPTYYLSDNNGNYLDYTDCGNTVNANHPVPLRLILDALHYWVKEMRVDGFRFDLASALNRDQDGHPLKNPPLIEAISHDPALMHIKLIAEAWDAHGLYQLGAFPNWGRWAEWNGRFRDVVRRFIKGDKGEAGNFATALCGSQELYNEAEDPYHSINFITCHDGFTLKDLVSYQQKHNEANGENNRDGTNDNASSNYGAEGPTKNQKILKVRAKQMRNFHTALMVSIGIPMLLMGDEYGHTRSGNNNSWCQDNELSWFLWKELDHSKELFRFFQLMIHFRKGRPLLRKKKFLTAEDVDWHGEKPFQPNWTASSHFIAYTLKDPIHHNPLYIAFNAAEAPASIQLPPAPPHRQWQRAVDTALASPEDILEDPKAHPPLKFTYEMAPHSAFIAEAL